VRDAASALSWDADAAVLLRSYDDLLALSG